MNVVQSRIYVNMVFVKTVKATSNVFVHLDLLLVQMVRSALMNDKNNVMKDIQEVSYVYLIV